MHYPTSAQKILRGAILLLVVSCAARSQADDFAARLKKARETADRGTAAALRDALADAQTIAAEAQKFGAGAFEADADYLAGVACLRMARFDEAAAWYRRAASLNRAQGRMERLGETLNDLGLALSRQGDQKAALATLNDALEIEKDLKPAQRAATLNNIGVAYNDAGDPSHAREALEQALAIQRGVGDRAREGAALSNIGALYYYEGDLQKALDSFREGARLREAAGDKRGAAASLSRMGLVYLVLNQPLQSLRYFEQALTVFRAAGDRNEESDALNGIAGAWLAAGQHAKALAFYEQSLKLERQTGKRAAAGAVLANIALVHRAAGDYPKALEALRAALAEMPEGTADARRIATIHHRTGAMLRVSGQPGKALESLALALPVARDLGDRRLESAVLYEQAACSADLGNLARARGDVEAALALAEQIRGSVAGYEMRSSYLASIHSQYELAIDVLMRSGETAAALEMAERAKARSLLDLISESSIAVERGVDPAARARIHALEASLNTLADRSLRLAPGPSQARSQLTAKAQSVAADLELERAQLRKTSPAYAELTGPEPIRLPQIQNLLDAGTVLVEYALGDRVSYAWVIGPQTVDAFTLAGRAAIGRRAREVYDGWSANRAVDASALSRIVLAPLLPKIQGRRIVFVADGALEFIPFTALPIPGRPSSQIIDEHEIVFAPSAATLRALRTAHENPSPGRPTAAVFADPVFSSDDLRVRPGAAARSASSFTRLPATRGEAEAIQALAGPNRSWILTDFEANRANALSERLAGYRIVHFATHGVVDAAHPELSGLVLSLVNREGAAQNGFLATHDIFNLQLRADLVVMSACRTALGQQIDGEGLVGLTRAFMYAGAPRVAASLWEAPDRATAELMRRFYTNLLRGGMPPAAALRRAKLSMRNEPKWSAPYYWAAFTMQGEWK